MSLKLNFCQEQHNLLHAVGAWHQRNYVRAIQHAKVIAHIQTEGGLSAHFAFMVILSSSIAILGLLLSSPAVVIGAMLISPLMGPIMLLGFSLCVLDTVQMKRALASLLVGIALAIFVSVAMVYASPLTEVTTEILARTQPNLFDLLVAIFSGLAGGYAVIKHKGEAIVGVAIATALMPPLAVVGFGLATVNPEIYKGALMLFMTNLLAIALTVTLLAKWYGFGFEHSPKHTVWQAVLILGVFTALSLPLGLSLKNIAYQAYVSKAAKIAITNEFNADSKLSLFSTSFLGRENLAIEAAVLTPAYSPQAQEHITAALIAKFDQAITLKLDQIIIAKEKIKQAQTTVSTDQIPPAPLPAKSLSALRLENFNTALMQAVFFPVRFIHVDPEINQALIYPQNVAGLSLTLLHQFEQMIATKFPDWHIGVIPPIQALPDLIFSQGKKPILNPDSEAALADIVWALTHWDAKKVTVIGYTTNPKELKKNHTLSLAYRYASYIGEKLGQADIRVTLKNEYMDIKPDAVNNGHLYKVGIRLLEP